MKSKVIYPPNADKAPKKCIFLAGSIEMGAAIDWQKIVIERLTDVDVTIFNPRRLDWDSSWKQGQHEEPFRTQVLWELCRIADAEIVFFYFDPKTKSPISLMELGLCLGGNKTVIVCCPLDFYRSANVAITCEVAGGEMVKYHENLDDAINDLIKELSC